MNAHTEGLLICMQRIGLLVASPDGCQAGRKLYLSSVSGEGTEKKGKKTKKKKVAAFQLAQLSRSIESFALA